MAIKLIGNYAKRLGLPGYSSHQFSVSVETELSDMEQVNAELSRLYNDLQSAVDREIQVTGFIPGDEYGRKLFAHTSPVYLNTVEGEVIDPDVIVKMITEIETNLAAIREHGTFASDKEREKVETIYEEAIEKLQSKFVP